MTITGQFINSDTGKPVPYVYTDVFATGDLTGIPADTFDSDGQGRFSYSSGVLDNGTAVLNTIPNGYHQLVGSPDTFTGQIGLYPTDSLVFKIPAWAWILLVAGAAYFGYKYYKSGKLKL